MRDPKNSRNPIRFHGPKYVGCGRLYVAMPHALAKDPTVTSVAVHVAVVIYSNREDWALSIGSIAAVCGLDRKTVSMGLAKLVELRWAAREALGGNRYVLHMARHDPFEVEDHARLNTFPVLVRNTDKVLVRNTDDNSVQTLSETSKERDSPDSGARGDSIGTSSDADGDSLKQEFEADDDPSRKPELMPSAWHTNGVHVKRGSYSGLKVTAVAAVFKSWAIGEQIRSSDWNAKFGQLLKCISEDLGLEDYGFDGITAYSADPDDFDWWLLPAYRFTAERKPA